MSHRVAAAVFLLQDSYRMCGDLCLKHITRVFGRPRPNRHGISKSASQNMRPPARRISAEDGKVQGDSL